MPHLDPTRRIFHTKADLKPTLGKPSADAGPRKQSQSEEPSAPPISGTKREVSSKPTDTVLCHMVVTRIYVDNSLEVDHDEKFKWVLNIYHFLQHNCSKSHSKASQHVNFSKKKIERLSNLTPLGGMCVSLVGPSMCMKSPMMSDASPTKVFRQVLF